MKLVDQAGAQIPPNRRYPAAHADVASAGCRSRLRQRGVDTFRDESKLRASRHPERRPRVMGEHETGV
jgi:hypothetical protein